MRLFVVIFAMCLPVPVLTGQQPSDRSSNFGEIKHGKSTHETNKTDKAKPEEAPAGACYGCSIESNPKSKDIASPTYDPRHDTLYRCYLIATIIGVFGGIVGIVLIYWQTLQIRKSADATRDSVKLQRAGMRQWIELDNWSSSIDKTASDPLTLTVQIVNRTPIPLKLGRITAQVGGDSRRGDEFREHWLVPQATYSMKIATKLSREQIEDYFRSSLIINFTASVSFKD